ncbi:MAG: nuclear transport factor 2 family protein [Chloroflexota bacterium]|nr:nuclear transport factor 2 family protein [Chloroflexota bacterium]
MTDDAHDPRADEAVVRRLIAALQARDVDELGAVLDDDVVYHFPGRGPLAGTYRGKAAVLDVFRSFGALFGPISVRTHDVVAGPEHVVEMAINSATVGGVSHEWRAVRLYHVRDGRLAEIWVLLEDPYALDELMAAPRTSA